MSFAEIEEYLAKKTVVPLTHNSMKDMGTNGRYPSSHDLFPSVADTVPSPTALVLSPADILIMVEKCQEVERTRCPNTNCRSMRIDKDPNYGQNYYKCGGCNRRFQRHVPPGRHIALAPKTIFDRIYGIE